MDKFEKDLHEIIDESKTIYSLDTAPTTALERFWAAPDRRKEIIHLFDSFYHEDKLNAYDAFWGTRVD